MWGKKRFLVSLVVFLIVVVFVFFILQIFFGRSVATTGIATVTGAICALLAALNKVVTDTRIKTVMDFLVKNQSVLQQYLLIKRPRLIPPHYSILYYANKDDERIAQEIKNTLEKVFICTVNPNPWKYPNEFQNILKIAEEAIHCIVVLTQTFYDDLQKDRRADIFVDELRQLATVQDGHSKGTLLLFPTLQVQNLFLGPNFSSFSITEDTLESFVGGNLYSRHCKRRDSASLQATGSTQTTVATPQQTGGSSQTVPEGIFIIAHDPNEFFIDRISQPELTLEKLENNFRYRYSGNTQILWGLNGNGKTQIVLAFAYKFQFSNSKSQVEASNPYSCILWLDATTSVYDGLVELNKDLLLKYPPETVFKDDPGDKLNEYKKLQSWLEDYEKQYLKLLPGKRWLLIIDKCKKKDFEIPYEIFKKLLSGDVFFTMYEDPGGTGKDVERRIEVEGMATKEGKATREGMLLLERTARNDKTFNPNGVETKRWETVREIVETLEGNPLAIDTAATYIMTKSPEEFLKNYKKEAGILYKRPQAARFAGKKEGKLFEAVAAAWYVAFDRIQEPGNEYAYQLLLLCAYLEFGAIPSKIIDYMPENNSYPFRDDESLRETSLELLRALSVIRWDFDPFRVRVKKIVRDLVQSGWDSAMGIGQRAESDQRANMIRAIRAVSAALPKTQVYLEKDYMPYLPHARKCVDYTEKLLWLDHTDDVLRGHLIMLGTAIGLDIVGLLYSTGCYLQRYPRDQKISGEAEHLLTTALRIRRHIREEIAGDFPDLATCLHALATFYYERSYQSDTSKLELAREHYLEALEERAARSTQAISRLDVDEVTLRKHLGQVYYALGACNEACEQYDEALKIINDNIKSLPTGVHWSTRVNLLFQRVRVLYNRAEALMKEGGVKLKDNLERAAAKNIFEQSRNEYIRVKANLDEVKAILLKEEATQKALMDNEGKKEDTPELKRIKGDQKELERLHIRWSIDLDTLNVISKPARILKGMYRDIENNYDKAIKQVKEDAPDLGRDVPEEIYLQLIIRHNNLGEVYRRWGRSHYQDAKASYEKAWGYYSMYYERYLKWRDEHHPIIEVIQDNLRTLPSKMIVDDQEKIQGFNYQGFLTRW